jgi:hypothetical protein
MVFVLDCLFGGIVLDGAHPNIGQYGFMAGHCRDCVNGCLPPPLCRSIRTVVSVSYYGGPVEITSMEKKRFDGIANMTRTEAIDLWLGLSTKN